MNRPAIIFSACFLVLSIVLEIVFRLGYGSLWWSKVPGFYAMLGFISCVALFLGSKWLGKLWLQKKVDYYSDFQREGEDE